jgi:hypothetical protein
LAQVNRRHGFKANEQQQQTSLSAAGGSGSGAGGTVEEESDAAAGPITTFDEGMNVCCLLMRFLQKARY